MTFMLRSPVNNSTQVWRTNKIFLTRRTKVIFVGFMLLARFRFHYRGVQFRLYLVSFFVFLDNWIQINLWCMSPLAFIRSYINVGLYNLIRVFRKFCHFRSHLLSSNRLYCQNLSQSSIWFQQLHCCHVLFRMDRWATIPVNRENNWIDWLIDWSMGFVKFASTKFHIRIMEHMKENKLKIRRCIYLQT